MNINGKTTSGLVYKLLHSSMRPRLLRSVHSIHNRSFDEPPIAILIDPTTQCNLLCSWCIDKHCIDDKFIPTERIIALLDELKQLDIKSIVYGGGGEPLIHGDFSLILNKTKELNIDYAVCTNGTLLNNASYEIASGAKWCRISMDAGSRKTYKNTHKFDYFDSIMLNISDLINIRSKLKSVITIGISYIMMDENYNEIVTITDYIKSIGCNFIQFKPLINLDNNIRTRYPYRPETINRIYELLEVAKSREDNDFSVLITDPLKNLLKNQVNDDKEYKFCYAQQIIPLVTPSGVYICGNWRGVNEKKIGDILTNSFYEIWNSDTRRKVINSLDPQEECKFPCIRHKTNEFLALLEKSVSLDIKFLDYLVEIDEPIVDCNFL